MKGLNSKTLFIILIGSLLTLHVKSQVTIGSGIPPIHRALLDLKEKYAESNNTNSSRGVSLPRVELTNLNELYPMYWDATRNTEKEEYTNNKLAIKKSHQGLLILHIGTANIAEGLFYWNGTRWLKIDERAIIAPRINNLQCGSASIVPSQYTQGIHYSGILSVPYIGGNGGSYSQGTKIGPFNGLYYQLQAGNLATGNGYVNFDIEGTPTISSPESTVLPISFLDIACNATIDTTQEIRTIQYARNTVTNMNTNTTRESVTSIGNIQVRYNYNISNPGRSKIEYRTLLPTHVSAMYKKVGSGGVNLESYSTRICRPNTSNNDWYDFAHSGGSNTATPDLNCVNRDIGTATLVLHNTTEVYRISLNTNVAIWQGGLTAHRL